MDEYWPIHGPTQKNGFSHQTWMNIGQFMVQFKRTGSPIKHGWILANSWSNLKERVLPSNMDEYWPIQGLTQKNGFSHQTWMNIGQFMVQFKRTGSPIKHGWILANSWPKLKERVLPSNMDEYWPIHGLNQKNGFSHQTWMNIGQFMVQFKRTGSPTKHGWLLAKSWSNLKDWLLPGHAGQDGHFMVQFKKTGFGQATGCPVSTASFSHLSFIKTTWQGVKFDSINFRLLHLQWRRGSKTGSACIVCVNTADFNTGFFL